MERNLPAIGSEAFVAACRRFFSALLFIGIFFKHDFGEYAGCQSIDRCIFDTPSLNEDNNAVFFIKKAFSIANSGNPETVSNKRSLVSPSPDRKIYDTALDDIPGTIRSFIIADTSGSNPEGIVHSAALLHSDNYLNLWVDTGVVVSQDDLARFVEKASSFVLPRVFALWGDTWADIDGNGKVSVLISRSINDAGRAIGFFNPSDLYERVDDIASNSWNPVSNEMDIVYLANPFGESDEFAYSLSSVLATLAHETYHLIMYSHKRYFLEQAGDSSSSGEEIFLDEGLAHLTESLVGLGVSGGNIAFLSRYLDNTSLVSAKGRDLDGQLDSVGKRGMMSAFLSWIFWQQGGATWDETDPSNIVDNGGIAFLGRLLRSNDRGWDCISTAASQLADTLLVEWFHHIEQEDRKPQIRSDPVFDPISDEMITLSPFAGEFQLGESTFVLDGPARVDFSSSNVTIAPYGVAFGDSITVEEKAYLSFSATQNTGFGVLRFYMY